MNRYQYFIAALQAGAYRWKEWVMTVFAVTNLPDNPGPDAYPYKLYSKEGVLYFNDPQTGLPVAIQNASLEEPLLYPDEPISLKVGDLPNVDRDIENASVGTTLFNAVVRCYPFGNKIPFREGKQHLGKLEQAIVKLLVDDGDDRVEQGMISVSELQKYIKAALNLGGYATLFSPSVTATSLVAAPGYVELRNALMEQYKNQLHDPAIIAKIGDLLEQLDREYIANDPEGGFYQKDKSFAIVRKKMLYMHGIEWNFDGAGITFIPTSLNDGWDIRNLPAMSNSLRDGSYSRGALTALGGEATKTIFRIMAGTIVSEDDCGTSLGIPMRLDNPEKYIGNTVIIDGAHIKIDESNVGELVGQHVMLRSPGYCKTKDNNYCRCCVGDFVIGKEDALPSICGEVGSDLLQMFMGRAHAVALKTTKFDFKKHLF